MTTQKVREDSTEALLVYPPFSQEGLYPPSAADVRIGTPSVDMPDEGSEEAATVDSVSTTLSAAASEGDESLTLASGAGLTAGRYYGIADVNGKRSAVRVLAVSGSTAYLDEPIAGDITSGSSFFGLACTHALTAAETEHSGPGLAIWRLTLDSVIVPRRQDFYIARTILPITLTVSRLLKRSEARRMLAPTDKTGQDLLEEGFDFVTRKLRARGVYEDFVQNPTELEGPHIEACLLLLRRATDRPEEDVEAQERRFRDALDDALASVRFDLASDTTGEATPTVDDDIDEWERARLRR